MDANEREEFLLNAALPYLESVAPDSRKYLGTFFSCAEKTAVYAVKFAYNNKWEVVSCVKFLN